MLVMTSRRVQNARPGAGPRRHRISHWTRDARESIFFRRRSASRLCRVLAPPATHHTGESSLSTSGRSSNEAWGSRIGLILAMAGNAVGLGNFLRFPSQAAQNGGGSFMITYFIALLLLGIPLMWIEWGIGRNGGRYRKGHLPGMFAAIWKHRAAKYVGVFGLAIPLIVIIYYTYIESWTLAFAWFSLTGDYFGRNSQEAMTEYLQSYQSIHDSSVHGIWKPFLFFFITLAVNIWVVSKGISGGIEKLAKI